VPVIHKGRARDTLYGRQVISVPVITSPPFAPYRRSNSIDTAGIAARVFVDRTRRRRIPNNPPPNPSPIRRRERRY